MDQKKERSKKKGRPKKKAEIVSSDFDQKMRDLLNEDSYYRTRKHLDEKGVLLAPEMSARLFEFFLSGSTPREISMVNPAIPIEAIWYAMVEQDWEEKKASYVAELLEKTKQKLMYAQSRTADMLSDMLLAAVTRHGDKYQKYLITKDESVLKGSPDVKGVGDITRVIEAIQKLTGADQIRKIKTEETHNLNITSGDQKDIEPEDAADILSILAQRRRKNENRN